MRCKACDKLLSDFEATRKIVYSDNTVEYPDLCNNCFEPSVFVGNSAVVERDDLADIEDIEIESEVFFFNTED